VKYDGRKLDFSQEEILKKCAIPTPVDAKRNMMNASSNYEIILAILKAIFKDEKNRIHVPGFDVILEDIRFGLMVRMESEHI